MRKVSIRIILISLFLTTSSQAQVKQDTRFPFFAYLTGKPTPKMIAYTPLELDPRQQANHRQLKTSSIRADLEALRPVFDGLVLYGYDESSTPRIVSIAKSLKFRAILLGIWDPRSAAEIDGAIELAKLYRKEMALAIVIGNEGITFKRYEMEDLRIALERVEKKIPKDIPLTTSEPLSGYQHKYIREFGHFLAPNIHPFFHREDLGPVQAAEWPRIESIKLAKNMNKPVLLKETGFPHGGKKGHDEKSQKVFWKAYVNAGLLKHDETFHKNWVYFGVAFEAFDLPWKSEASGLPVEKYWGLFSVQRKAYPALEVWK